MLKICHSEMIKKRRAWLKILDYSVFSILEQNTMIPHSSVYLQLKGGERRKTNKLWVEVFCHVKACRLCCVNFFKDIYFLTKDSQGFQGYHYNGRDWEWCANFNHGFFFLNHGARRGKHRLQVFQNSSCYSGNPSAGTSSWGRAGEEGELIGPQCLSRSRIQNTQNPLFVLRGVAVL